MIRIYLYVWVGECVTVFFALHVALESLLSKCCLRAGLGPDYLSTELFLTPVLTMLLSPLCTVSLVSSPF